VREPEHAQKSKLRRRNCHANNQIIKKRKTHLADRVQRARQLFADAPMRGSLCLERGHVLRTLCVQRRIGGRGGRGDRVAIGDQLSRLAQTPLPLGLARLV
jgi:hypothetical protein